MAVGREEIAKAADGAGVKFFGPSITSWLSLATDVKPEDFYIGKAYCIGKFIELSLLS